MLIAAHQPDLLPYSGFWYKMAKADVFDLKVYDQFLRQGYQRRVSMRGEWAAIPVIKAPQLTSILDMRIDPDHAGLQLRNLIVGRYNGADGWERYGKELVDRIGDIRTNRLWQFNLELILVVRDMLGITTPLGISTKPERKKGEGVIDSLNRYPNPTYLSGTGAMAYMGDLHEFHEAGIPVVWSRHKAATGESVVTVMMDHEDPMKVILAEKDPDEPDEAHNTPSQGVLR